MSLTHKIPVGLTLLRAALGPLVLLCALLKPMAAVFGACLVVAFLSDVFDGVIARRLQIATARIRRLDSIADSVFYVSAGIAAFLLYPQAVRQRAAPLAVLVALELLRYAVDYAKFRRETAYHMWSSKAWGLALFAGFLSLLGFGHAGMPVSLAIYAGIVADVEGLLISLVLPHWRHDVPTVLHALRMRRASPG
jgi:CDP-diacylglycerol--glycerol-3-phosphate 3-phosphatidyltransferase